jgi:hypothetical protein
VQRKGDCLLRILGEELKHASKRVLTSSPSEPGVPVSPIDAV